MIKNFFVLPIQKIFRQHFGLYSSYDILVTKFFLLEFLFPALRFHQSSHSSPFFFPPLTTRKSIREYPLQFVPLVFEVLGPDTLDIVICLASSSLSSELITISSHAFSCSSLPMPSASRSSPQISLKFSL